ncbi:MAG: right-handed parallel beta-helix repeat-containing protein [Candidatus Omnitrophota bacterium]
MRLLIMALMVVTGISYAVGAFAATYYISPGGNDLSVGTSLQNPWQTLSKVNASRFLPGDAVLLQRGGQWREKLTILSSGTAEGPITMGAYGEGNLPIINGADDFSSPRFYWKASRYAHVWYLLTAEGAKVNMDEPGGVWINGVYQFNGKYNGTRWQAYSVGSLTENTWQWADADGLGFSTVYIYQLSDPNTAGVTIEASQRSYCVRIDKQQFIILENLELKQSGKKNITEPILYLYQAPHIVVKHCRIHDSSGQIGAIYVLRSHDFTLEGSRVYNSYDPDGNGYGTLIMFESTSAGQTDNAIVRNNVIFGAYARLADLLGSVGAWSGSVAYGAKYCVIEKNEFYGPGQNAVYFRSGANNNIIRNNYIHDIKGYEENGGIGVQLRDNANNNFVYNNVVLNVYGPTMQSDGRNGGPNSSDPACDGNKFFNNTIYNGSYPGSNGFHFFGTNRNLEVRNNIVVSNSGDMILVSEDVAAHTYDGITLSNNRYFKITPNGQEFVYRGVNYETLAAFIAAMGRDGFVNEGGSSYGDPGFMGSPIRTGDDLRLNPLSLCIDAGTAIPWFNDDFSAGDRSAGNAWDIGAYEFNRSAGDVSADGRVTMYDAALVLKYTIGGALTSAQQAQADMNGDAVIDAADAAAMAKKAVGIN